MSRIAISIAAALALALGSAACGGGSDEPTSEQVSVATATSASYRVELLGTAVGGKPPLKVGLNRLALRVTTAAGAPVGDATVTFAPLMTMPAMPPAPAMTHSCPVMGPGAHAGDGRYPVDVVFQMASEGASGASLGTWSAEVTVARTGAADETVSFPVLEVPHAQYPLARSFVSGMTRYVMALEFTESLEVGVNPIVVTLHETADMGMTFQPVDDATLVADEQMPSMGHGGGDNTNPAYVSPGWYEGTVGFTMVGDWRVTVTASRGGTEIGAPFFDLYF